MNAVCEGDDIPDEKPLHVACYGDQFCAVIDLAALPDAARSK